MVFLATKAALAATIVGIGVTFGALSYLSRALAIYATPPMRPATASVAPLPYANHNHIISYQVTPPRALPRSHQPKDDFYSGHRQETLTGRSVNGSSSHVPSGGNFPFPISFQRDSQSQSQSSLPNQQPFNFPRLNLPRLFGGTERTPSDCNCKLIYECSTFFGGASQSFRLRRTCGFQGFQRKVCCDEGPFFSTPPPSVALDEMKSVQAQLSLGCNHALEGHSTFKCNCDDHQHLFDDLRHGNEGSQSEGSFRSEAGSLSTETVKIDSSTMSPHEIEQDEELKPKTEEPRRRIAFTTDVKEYFRDDKEEDESYQSTLPPISNDEKEVSGAKIGNDFEGDAKSTTMGSTSTSTEKFPSLNEYFPDGEGSDPSKSLARTTTMKSASVPDSEEDPSNGEKKVMDEELTTTTKEGTLNLDDEETSTMTNRFRAEEIKYHEMNDPTPASILEDSPRLTESLDPVPIETTMDDKNVNDITSAYAEVEVTTPSATTSSASPIETTTFPTVNRKGIADTQTLLEVTEYPTTFQPPPTNPQSDFPDVTETIIHGSRKGTASPQSLQLERDDLVNNKPEDEGLSTIQTSTSVSMAISSESRTVTNTTSGPIRESSTMSSADLEITLPPSPTLEEEEVSGASQEPSTVSTTISSERHPFAFDMEAKTTTSSPLQETTQGTGSQTEQVTTMSGQDDSEASQQMITTTDKPGSEDESKNEIQIQTSTETGHGTGRSMLERNEEKLPSTASPSTIESTTLSDMMTPEGTTSSNTEDSIMTTTEEMELPQARLAPGRTTVSDHIAKNVEMGKADMPPLPLDTPPSSSTTAPESEDLTTTGRPSDGEDDPGISERSQQLPTSTPEILSTTPTATTESSELERSTTSKVNEEASTVMPSSQDDEPATSFSTETGPQFTTTEEPRATSEEVTVPPEKSLLDDIMSMFSELTTIPPDEPIPNSTTTSSPTITTPSPMSQEATTVENIAGTLRIIEVSMTTPSPPSTPKSDETVAESNVLATSTEASTSEPPPGIDDEEMTTTGAETMPISTTMESFSERSTDKPTSSPMSSDSRTENEDKTTTTVPFINMPLDDEIIEMMTSTQIVTATGEPTATDNSSESVYSTTPFSSKKMMEQVEGEIMVTTPKTDIEEEETTLRNYPRAEELHYQRDNPTPTPISVDSGSTTDKLDPVPNETTELRIDDEMAKEVNKSNESSNEHDKNEAEMTTTKAGESSTSYSPDLPEKSLDQTTTEKFEESPEMNDETPTSTTSNPSGIESLETTTLPQAASSLKLNRNEDESIPSTISSDDNDTTTMTNMGQYETSTPSSKSSIDEIAMSSEIPSTTPTTPVPTTPFSLEGWSTTYESVMLNDGDGEVEMTTVSSGGEVASSSSSSRTQFTTTTMSNTENATESSMTTPGNSLDDEPDLEATTTSPDPVIAKGIEVTANVIISSTLANAMSRILETTTVEPKVLEASSIPSTEATMEDAKDTTEVATQPSTTTSIAPTTEDGEDSNPTTTVSNPIPIEDIISDMVSNNSTEATATETSTTAAETTTEDDMDMETTTEMFELPQPRLAPSRIPASSIISIAGVTPQTTTTTSTTEGYQQQSENDSTTTGDDIEMTTIGSEMATSTLSDVPTTTMSREEDLQNQNASIISDVMEEAIPMTTYSSEMTTLSEMSSLPTTTTSPEEDIGNQNASIFSISDVTEKGIETTTFNYEMTTSSDMPTLPTTTTSPEEDPKNKTASGISDVTEEGIPMTTYSSEMSTLSDISSLPTTTTAPEDDMTGEVDLAAMDDNESTTFNATGLEVTTMGTMQTEASAATPSPNETHASYGATTEYPDPTEVTVTMPSIESESNSTELEVEATTFATSASTVDFDDEDQPVTEITKSIRREPDTDKTIVKLTSMTSALRTKVRKTVNAIRSGSESSVSELMTESPSTTERVTTEQATTESGTTEVEVSEYLDDDSVQPTTENEGIVEDFTYQANSGNDTTTEEIVPTTETPQVTDNDISGEEEDLQNQSTTIATATSENSQEDFIQPTTEVGGLEDDGDQMSNSTETATDNLQETTTGGSDSIDGLIQDSTTEKGTIDEDSSESTIKISTDRDILAETTSKENIIEEEEQDKSEQTTTVAEIDAQNDDGVPQQTTEIGSTSTDGPPREESDATSLPEKPGVVTEKVIETELDVGTTTTEKDSTIPSLNIDFDEMEGGNDNDTSTILASSMEIRHSGGSVMDLRIESSTAPSPTSTPTTDMPDSSTYSMTVTEAPVVSDSTPEKILELVTTEASSERISADEGHSETIEEIGTSTVLPNSDVIKMGEDLDSDEVLDFDLQETSTVSPIEANEGTTVQTKSDEEYSSSVLDEVYDAIFDSSGRSARVNHLGHYSKSASTTIASTPEVRTTTTPPPPFTVEVKIGPYDARSLFSSAPTSVEKQLEGEISNVVGQLLLTTHKNFHLLPSFIECAGARGRTGRRKTRVLQFDTDNYPWMARIGFREPRGILFPCAGTIISRRYILTSANCATRIPSDSSSMEILLEGAKLAARGMSEVEQSHYKYSVDEVVIHQNYDKTTRENDLALIRLSKEIPQFNGSSEVKPICLPFEDGYGVWDSLPKEGETAYLGGWGYGLKNMAAKVEEMDEAAVTIWPNANCTYLYRGDYQKRITPQHICAYGKVEKDACRGDAGGPLMALMTRQRLFFQIGIVSYGPRCGYGVPAVYTRVSEYLSWILDSMRP